MTGKELIAFLAISLLPVAANSCSCLALSGLTDAQQVQLNLDLSDVVFLGKAEFVNVSEPDSIQTTTFRLIDSYMGESSYYLTIIGTTHSNACGYRFEKEKTYLVFGMKREGGHYWTSSCMLTSPHKSATEFLDILNDMRALQ